MASLVFDAGRKAVADATFTWTGSTIRAILVTGGEPAGTESDVAAVLAGTPDEASGGSYAAIDLTGKVAPSTVDGEYKADKAVFTKPSSGANIIGVLVMKFVTNYAGSTPVWWHLFSTARTADGGTLEVRWNGDATNGKVGEIN